MSTAVARVAAVVGVAAVTGVISVTGMAATGMAVAVGMLLVRGVGVLVTGVRRTHVNSSIVSGDFALRSYTP